MDIERIITDPMFVKLASEVMAMDADINEDYLIPFTMDEEDDDGNKIVRQRKGDYGEVVNYVPAKYVRERADLAFKKKYTFMIIAERREVEPFERRRYNRESEEYDEFPGDKYLKCIGMMIVPGLGIRMEYGVKKVRGGTEASDWKACKTDAFKKCCESFGIYLDYDMDDADEEERSRSSGGNDDDDDNPNKTAKEISELDLSDVEYTDDELEDARNYEISWARKYPNWTLGEILEDDPSYVIWILNNAREKETRELAAIVLKAEQDEENDRPSRRKASKDGKKESKSKKSGKSSKSSASSGKDEKRRQKLIELCEVALEDYDKIQQKSFIKSVSVSSEYRTGKTKLSQLTLRELEQLAEVLSSGDE